jgi:hypothetical protein
MFVAASWPDRLRAQPRASEECRPAAGGWISVSTPEPTVDSALHWADVVAHVRSELALRSVALCNAASAEQKLADLAFESDVAGRVRIRLATGPERLPVAERTLDLSSVPLDARLLSIAVAADELLAANWAELEQRRARARPPPVSAPPPPPLPIPAKELTFELGPGFVYESFAGGQTLLGAELRAGVRLAPPLLLTARLGFRQGLPEAAPHGSLHSSGLLGGLGLRLRLLQGERFSLALHGRADALRLAVSAYAEAGATAHDRHDVALLLTAGPTASLALSRSIRITLDSSAGSAVRPVHITDSGARVSGVSGLALAAGGGVLVAF